MLNQPSADMGSNLLSQLGPFFPKPGTGLPPTALWEGGLAPQGPPGAFPSAAALPQVGLNNAALTGAASGLQAAAQSLLRQRMEALRQQGVGLRGTVGPRGWEAEVTWQTCGMLFMSSTAYGETYGSFCGSLGIENAFRS